MNEPAGALTTTRYIVRDQRILSGEPIIVGTRTPVRSIVEMWRLGISPEEIPFRYPHLTLAQVFDALSFYQDNMVEINGYIKLNCVPDDLVDQAVKKQFGLP